MSFPHHFPVTSSHLKNFFTGTPNEEYCKKQSKAGKKVCALMAGKKIIIYPLSLPFLTSYSLGLTALKICETALRGFTLLSCKKKYADHFVNTAKQAIDYSMLSALLPLKITAEIVKLLIAALFDPRLVFSSPEKYSVPVQIDYFKDKIHEEFFKFSSSQALSLQIKAELHDLEQAHLKLLQELKPQETKLKWLKFLMPMIKSIYPNKVKSNDLDALRFSTKQFGIEAGITIVFKPIRKTF